LENYAANEPSPVKLIDYPTARFERAIDQFAREPNAGLIVLPNPITLGNRKLIIAMAARHRLPAAYVYRYLVAEGGLISYGNDVSDQYRQDGVLAEWSRAPPRPGGHPSPGPRSPP
jgi:putative ABC transport system substrate-binding protein